MSYLYDYQFVSYESKTGDVVVDTFLQAFPDFMESHVDAPIGATDLSGILASLVNPRFLMIYSVNHKPFQVDLGAGPVPINNTTFITSLKQGSPVSIGVVCQDLNHLRVVAAGVQ